MDYYLLRYIINNSDRICIWYSSDTDGFCVNEEKKIITFSDINSTMFYLSENNLSLINDNDETSINEYDFDKLSNWLDSDDVFVECNEILNMWNIFTDTAFSIGQSFIGDEKNEFIRLIYNKLFYGCNLLKPEGEEDFIPRWDREQIKVLKSVLKKGFNMFIENVICIPT